MIRKFKQNDTDAVMQIWKNENIKAHDFISRDYWNNNFEYVKTALSEAEIYVFEENCEILGFIGLNGSYVEGIFVNSGSQHKGIGTDLLNKAKEMHCELTLSVYEKNIKARLFYEKNGFEIISCGTDCETDEKEFRMMWNAV